MSFTSFSARANSPIREYEFVSNTAQGFEDVKSARFDKKYKKDHSDRMTQNTIVPMDNKHHSDSFLSPISLSQVDMSAYQDGDIQSLPYSFQKDQDVLNWMAGMVEQSPNGRALLKRAQAAGWMIVLEDLNQNGFEIDSDICLITLDHFGFSPHALGRSIHYKNAVLLNFIRALRHVWHEDQNYDYPVTHRPDVVVMMERGRAADCETIAILIAWELRTSGYGEAWRHMLGSDEGDMAMIFTTIMEKDPSGFYDGTVLTRTFCQWYGDEGRITAQDHKILEDMDEDLKAGFKFGDKPLRRDDIEKLSGMPDGQIYLNGMGQNICTDPYFLSMNDTINESHLFQIVYDSNIMLVEGVPFRDRKLASLIFPHKKIKVL